MWIDKLLSRLPEGRQAAENHFEQGRIDPSAYVSHPSKWARMGAASDADAETAAHLTKDECQEVRIAARERLATLRWSTPPKVLKERIRDHH